MLRTMRFEDRAFQASAIADILVPPIWVSNTWEATRMNANNSTNGATMKAISVTGIRRINLFIESESMIHSLIPLITTRLASFASTRCPRLTDSQIITHHQWQDTLSILRHAKHLMQHPIHPGNRRSLIHLLQILQQAQHV